MYLDTSKFNTDLCSSSVVSLRSVSLISSYPFVLDILANKFRLLLLVLSELVVFLSALNDCERLTGF
jgi:hypothetical protein